MMVVLASIATSPSSSTSGLPESLVLYDQTKERTVSTPLVFENFVATTYLESEPLFDVTTEPLAKSFESIIGAHINAVGANFAGKYSIASWSCGPKCQQSTIIDLESGAVVEHGIISFYGLSYSPDSRLLIINPKDTTRDEEVVTDYYELTDDNELNLLSKEMDGVNVIPGCILAQATARNTLTNEIETFETPCRVPFGWEIITNR